MGTREQSDKIGEQGNKANILNRTPTPSPLGDPQLVRRRGRHLNQCQRQRFVAYYVRIIWIAEIRFSISRPDAFCTQF